jgi:hypothetical protein
MTTRQPTDVEEALRPRETAQIIAGYRNMDSEGDYPAAVKHLCELLENTRPKPSEPTGGGVLLAAARDLLAGKCSTYKARNGREMGIEGDDGEKCWIVHSDLIAALETALSAHPPALVGLDREQVARIEAKAAKLERGRLVDVGDVFTLAMHNAMVHEDHLFAADLRALLALIDQGGEDLGSAQGISRPSAARDALTFIGNLADLRSRDNSKVFARVCRGALRTIAERANEALGLEPPPAVQAQDAEA